jgi:hypothetical protein
MDPTADIFVDPCNPLYEPPSEIEIKMFKHYTDRYKLVKEIFNFFQVCLQ